MDQQVIVIEEENRKLQSEQDMTRQMNEELNIEIEGIRQEKDALEKQVFDQVRSIDDAQGK